MRADARESRMPPKVSDVLRAEAHRLQELQGLLEAGSDQKIPPRRQAADEKLKRGAGLEMRLEIARRHGQFVQVGQQTGGCRVVVIGFPNHYATDCGGESSAGPNGSDRAAAVRQADRCGGRL